jgi:hypothetical protein
MASPINPRRVTEGLTAVVIGTIATTAQSDKLGAAFDGEALSAPAQHAAGEVGDLVEAGLAEHQGGLSRASAGAADHDHRPLLVKRTAPVRQRPERNERCTWHVPERSVEFVGLAHVKHLHVAQVLFKPVRLHFADAGEGAQMGQIIGAVKGKVGNTADGARIAALVKKNLS